MSRTGIFFQVYMFGPIESHSWSSNYDRLNIHYLPLVRADSLYAMGEDRNINPHPGAFGIVEADGYERGSPRPA